MLGSFLRKPLAFSWVKSEITLVTGLRKERITEQLSWARERRGEEHGKRERERAK